MKFTIHEIYKPADRAPLFAKDLAKVFLTNRCEYTLNDVLYVFQIEQNSNYCFIEIKHGKTDAIDCYDKNQKSFTDTILNDNLVHTAEQFFILIKYCQDHTYLYLSDWAKRSIFLSYCGTKKLELKLLDMTSDIQDFASKISKLNKISFKATDNLFIKDFFSPHWYEEWDQIVPKGFHINISYKCKVTNTWLDKQYKKLQGQLFVDNLQFEGQDDTNKVLIFNTKALVSKLDIPIEKQEGYYNSQDVKKQLLGVIK